MMGSTLRVIIMYGFAFRKKQNISIMLPSAFFQHFHLLMHNLQFQLQLTNPTATFLLSILHLLNIFE